MYSLVILATEFLQLLFAVVSYFILFVRWILESRTFLFEQPEPEHPRHISLIVLWDVNVRSILLCVNLNYHHKYTREGTPKIGSIHIRTFLLRYVDLLASGAENLDSTGSQFLTHSNWQHILSFAKYTRTCTKASSLELLLHQGESPRCDDEACVNQTIQISGLLVDLQEALILQVFIVWRLG